MDVGLQLRLLGIAWAWQQTKNATFLGFLGFFLIFFFHGGLQLRLPGIAWALAADKEYYILFFFLGYLLVRDFC